MVVIGVPPDRNLAAKGSALCSTSLTSGSRRTRGFLWFRPKEPKPWCPRVAWRGYRRPRYPDRASCSGYAPTRRPCRDGACSTSCLAPPARAARSGHPPRAQGLARCCAASPRCPAGAHVGACACHPWRYVSENRTPARTSLSGRSSRCDLPLANRSRLPPCTRAGVAPARRGWLAMDGQPRPVTTGTSCQADPEHRRCAGARPARAGAGHANIPMLVAIHGAALALSNHPRPGRPVRAFDTLRRATGASVVSHPLFGSFLWASRERNPHRAE